MPTRKILLAISAVHGLSPSVQGEDIDGAVRKAVKQSTLSKGGVAMAIEVVQVSPGQLDSKNNFEMRGHEHVHAFTDEVRWKFSSRAINRASRLFNS
jgi:hypothetical protein